MKLPTFVKRIGSDNSGVTAVEYGLIVALVVVVRTVLFVLLVHIVHIVHRIGNQLLVLG